MTIRFWLTTLLAAHLFMTPASARADDDVDNAASVSEEELEDELEDEMEDELEESEELEDEFEDELEDMLEDHDDYEDELEDDLEDRLEDQLEDLQRYNEELIERETERLQDLWQIEEQLEDLESFVIPDEYIALLSEAELQQLQQNGAEIISSEPLSELDAVLVTFADADQAAEYQNDSNHLSLLDDAPPVVTASPEPVSRLMTMLGITSQHPASSVIGMMDSSIELNHPCFSGVAVHERSFYPDHLHADTGHGTAMASVMGGACGVLSEARIVNAAVFARSPRGLVVASAREMITGLNWLVSQQVAVINLSLSGPPNRILEMALQRIADRGIALVASSGNDGAAAFPRYPAAYPHVLAVTAVDRQQNIYPLAVQGKHLDFAAPGVDVEVADGASDQMRSMSGTSLAAAFVTAALAQTEQTPEELRSLTTDLGERGHDAIFGYGLLQLNKKTEK